MEIAIQLFGKYWSYLNVHITDKICILISLARVIWYWISFVECYIAQSHYLNRWRLFFANGPFTNFIEIWMKMENFPFQESAYQNVFSDMSPCVLNM